MASRLAERVTSLQAVSALRHRNFRLYWFSGMGQSAALGMQFLILGWLVLELTDSPAQLGLVVAIYGAPNLALLMFGGIVADRLDRRWLLFYSRLIVTALIVLAATLTLYDDHQHLVHLRDCVHAGYYPRPEYARADGDSA